MRPWHQRIKWARVLGATAILGSWISQNYFQARSRSELAYLYQSQELISIEQGLLDQWYGRFLHEQLKPDPNRTLLGIYAQRATQNILNILTWSEARITDGHSIPEQMEQKREFLERGKQLLAVGDADGIIKLMNSALLTSAISIDGHLEAFGNRVEQYRSDDEAWDNFYLVSYIAGSLLVAASVVAEWLRDNESENLSRQQRRAAVRAIGRENP
jgi:hypothetical protein